MAFIRTIKRDNPFSQIDRYVFENDDSISWKAKGLMGYLLTRPDDWKINHKDLVNRAKDGKDAVTSALKELEKAGYIHHYQERNENGKFGEWIYDVYERPEFNPLHQTEKPNPENPNPDIPNPDKPDYSNNKGTNINFTNNNNITTTSTREKIDSEFKKQFPNVDLELAKQQAFEQFEIKTDNQYYASVLMKIHDLSKKPKKKKAPTVRKEMLPDWFNENEEMPKEEKTEEQLSREEFERKKAELFGRIKNYKEQNQ